MNYRIVYSKRKTLSICVKDCEVIVRSPYGVSKNKIDKMVLSHAAWIESKLEIQRRRKSIQSELSDDDIKRLKLEAKEYFTVEIEKYSETMNLKYSRMKITSAQKRFGSCNSNGTICFSYRLMLYPPRAREYVVVHELAHLKYMNHSKSFYKLIESYMPDYKERIRLLK